MSFHQAQCPVDILYSWESVVCNELCCSQYSLESHAVMAGATAIPYSDTPSQDALCGTAVQLRVQSEYLHLPQESLALGRRP